MTNAIHGEISADGTTLVLMAAGADWQVARAAGALSQLTSLIRPSSPPGALTLPVSWQAVTQLAATFTGDGHGSWRPGPHLTEWITQELIRRTTPGTGLSATLPRGCIPRDYQVAAARMIADVGRVLLLDEAGAGKTISTIIGLLERAKAVNVLPVLVVCPASVTDPWVSAFRTWAPGWRTAAWRGTPVQRRELPDTADVFVASYDTARIDSADKGPLTRLQSGTVVADECHFLKNPHSRRSQAVRRLAKRAGTVVALSGTPISHHAGDLWPSLEALAPAAWPSRERWIRRYCITANGDYSEDVKGLNPYTEPELRTALLGQHRRVAKADVLTQLPPKVYSIRAVELPPEWRRVYNSMEADMLAALPDGAEISVMSVLAQMTRLIQMASAAADVEVTTELDDEGNEHEHVSVKLKAPSWKVDALLEVLAERPGSPVVTFAPSAQLIVLAGQAAEKAGYKVGYVIGGQLMAERTRTITAFQTGKLDLLAATTGAGGTGLTFTASSTAVFLQRPWSLNDAIQAEDRLHRIGAEHHESIEVIDVVARDTIDTRIRSVLRSKAGALAELVQDPRIVTELLGGARS